MTDKEISPLPAAAGGDHRAQLRHLKAHLKFQNQTRYHEVRLDWATVINREQSRRHITHELHRKINTKDPDYRPAGKLDSEAGQQELRSLARHATGGPHTRGSGDAVRAGWSLRFRICRERSRRLGISEARFWEMMDHRRPPPLRRKEAEFPLEIQTRHALHRMARELVIRQGASPKKHRDAIIMTAYRCPVCKNAQLPDTDSEVTESECSACSAILHGAYLEQMAFDPGETPQYIHSGPQQAADHKHRVPRTYATAA